MIKSSSSAAAASSASAALFVSVLALLTFSFTGVQAQQCPGVLTCKSTSTPPKLDGDFSDWASVTGGISTPLYSYFGTQYEGGNGNYKCTYDSNKIYFALEIPGKYSFNASGGHQSPAIGTMTKIGAKASFINMGGCPDGQGVCNNTIPFPTSCDPYIVDIGAHWQTRTTKQGVEYPINTSGTTGRDAVSRKDDEYAVGPQCRRADDGANAANEWAGAWTHTANTTIGADGFYRFELSRLLSTASARTDAQFVAGNTYSFGIAFWDPFESATGWTDPGHYLSGCGFKWIDLVLAKSASDVVSPTAAPVAAATNPPTALATNSPTKKPVAPPTITPTIKPVVSPTITPTTKPVVIAATNPPTVQPVVAVTTPPFSQPVTSPTVSIPVIGVPFTTKPTSSVTAPQQGPKRSKRGRTRKPKAKSGKP